LVANYNDDYDGTKNKPSTEASRRGYTPEQLAAAQTSLGQKFNSVESCNLRFTKPFAHLKYDLLSYVLVLFENYEKGCLPFPGSASEQPAQIMEIFNILRQLKHEVQVKAQHEQAKR
jgi:hypothetical protein